MISHLIDVDVDLYAWPLKKCAAENEGPESRLVQPEKPKRTQGYPRAEYLVAPHKFEFCPTDASLDWISVSKLGWWPQGCVDRRFGKPSTTGMAEITFPVMICTSATRLVTGTFDLASPACLASAWLSMRAGMSSLTEFTYA
jgi:hypothetical protein